ncbi:MAG: peptidase P60 [Alphaproteobacteria bacterium]|nr:peptidase P60 [Alphaproteobacteria bacterium]
MAEETRKITAPAAELREKPDASALRGKLESQLVYGEGFIVESEENGWCKGRCAHDGYAGYVEAKHLGAIDSDPFHVITAARSHVYRDATMKSPMVTTLSFGSKLRLTGKEENGYRELESGDGFGGWIYARHLGEIGEPEEDYVATARRFLETPYYWGGRSGFGIDCSGLVQACLSRAGLSVPRDTEEQIKLGREHNRPRTGDLVFFKGHVGIMLNEDNILHANAHHMKVTEEPLWMAEDRVEGGITAIRRI